MPDAEPQSARATLRRHAERGRYDAEAVNEILDAGILAHVAVSTAHGPFAIPMAYGRIGRRLYLHGALANSLLIAGESGACVTVTLLDGLVLARSAMHHSANFRSVVAFGLLVRVIDCDEARAGLAAVLDHIVPGRSADTRAVSDAELRATRVVSLDLAEASAKVRTGDPVEDDDDLEAPLWSGVVPLRMVADAPITAALTTGGAPVPASVLGWQPR